MTQQHDAARRSRATPDGVRCTGGLPEIEATHVDLAFILPAVAVLMLAFGAAALHQSGR